MSTHPRILLLCSGRLAVPAAQYLASAGLLTGVAVPDANPQATDLLGQLATSLQQPFHILTRPSLTSVLESLLSAQRPDAVFVIGFPWRIPEKLLSLPREGFLNFHAGLLPDFRGPDPIFEAIRRQLTQTALTVHRMDAGFDTGPVVLEDRFALTADVTHGMLGTQIAFRAVQAARQIADLLQAGPLPLSGQSWSDAPYYPRVSTQELYLRWQSQSAGELAALIRACNPIYGGAATLINGWNIRMTDASVFPGAVQQAPAGTLLELSAARGALIQCENASVLQVHIVNTDEGYFPAVRLQSFGLRPGLVFGNPNPVDR